MRVVGHAGLAVGPVLGAQHHDGAHGEEGGRRGDAGIGINAFLCLYSQRASEKNVFLSVFIHISVHSGSFLRMPTHLSKLVAMNDTNRKIIFRYIVNQILKEKK